MPAEALLRGVWDGVETALVLYDAFGQLMANPAAARLGLTPGAGERPACSGRVAGRVVYVADGMTVCPEAQWPVNRALRGETVRNQELLISDDEHPHGRRFVISAHPLHLPNGSAAALVTFRESARNQQDQRANSASLDELSMLMDGAAGYVILQLGPDGEVRSWSKNARQLLGYTREEIVGRPYAMFFRAGDAASGVPGSILGQARMHGSAKTGGVRVRKDGSTFWADGVITAVRDGGGEVVAFVKVVHDVTPRYQAERAVQKLNRELSELNEGFSYSVAHDLRAPVRAVHGFSRLLEERHGHVLPPDAQLLLGQIENSALRLGHLIDGLLLLSRIQRQPMEPKKIDMTALAQRCWTDVASRYPGLATTFEIEPLMPVTADPQLLRQVWLNLLDNAVKFSGSPAEPSVRVTSRAEHAQVVFEVIDNGAGFDMRYSEKLFKVFQRLHRDQFPGVGIGLAIAYRVISRHGGRIWATSDAGHETRFSFSLPVNGNPESVVDASTATAAMVE